MPAVLRCKPGRPSAPSEVTQNSSADPSLRRAGTGVGGARPPRCLLTMYSWPTTAGFLPIRHENERQAGRLRADATGEVELQGRTLIPKRIAVRTGSVPIRIPTGQRSTGRWTSIPAIAVSITFPRKRFVQPFTSRGGNARSCADRTSAIMQGRRRRSCSVPAQADDQSTWSTALPPMRRFSRASIAGPGWRHEHSSSIWPSSRPSAASVHSRVRSLAALAWAASSSGRFSV